MTFFSIQASLGDRMRCKEVFEEDDDQYDTIDIPEDTRSRNVTRYPYCGRCNGPHYTARFMAYCSTCMQELAREEEENCERIYREFSRRSQVARRTAEDRNVDRRVVVVMGRMAEEDTVVEKDMEEADIRKEQRKCEKLFCSSTPITIAAIPFEGLCSRDIVTILLRGVVMSQPAVVKTRIREEVRRWHPDKFLQKLGLRLVTEEKEEVMERVKCISQALNDYGKLSSRA